MATGSIDLRLYFGDLTTYVDLINGPIRVKWGHWRPQFSSTNQQQVTEIIPCIADGDPSTQEIESEIENIEKIFRQARQYQTDEDFEGPPVVRWSPNPDSPNFQYSLILDGEIQSGADRRFSPFIQSGETATEFRIIVYRHPLWERNSQATPLLSETGISSLGGTASISSSSGSQPGRISVFKVQVDSGGPIDKIWAGIRPEFHGLTDFNPVFLQTNGAAYTDTTKTSTMTTDFATVTEMDRRWGNTINNYQPGVTNFEHYFGSYQILLLARCLTSPMTVAFQMRYGYSNTPLANLIKLPTVEFSDTSWRIVSLGNIKIPPYPKPDTTLVSQRKDAQYFQFYCYIQRLVGSGTYSVECGRFILMPTHHSIYLSGLNIQTTDPVEALVRYDDKFVVYTDQSTGGRLLPTDVAPRNWYMPPGDSTLVMVAERSTQQVATDDLEVVQMSYYPRTRSYNKA